jgi:hypothetical protein
VANGEAWTQLREQLLKSRDHYFPQPYIDQMYPPFEHRPIILPTKAAEDHALGWDYRKALGY